jgi:hypothetical protein
VKLFKSSLFSALLLAFLSVTSGCAFQHYTGGTYPGGTIMSYPSSYASRVDIINQTQYPMYVFVGQAMLVDADKATKSFRPHVVEPGGNCTLAGMYGLNGSQNPVVTVKVGLDPDHIIATAWRQFYMGSWDYQYTTTQPWGVTEDQLRSINDTRLSEK